MWAFLLGAGTIDISACSGSLLKGVSRCPVGYDLRVKVATLLFVTGLYWGALVYVLAPPVLVVALIVEFLSRRRRPDR